jgi:hypothetical protein
MELIADIRIKIKIIIFTVRNIGEINTNHHHRHHQAIKELGHFMTVPISRIQKYLQWCSLVPSAFWG